jgi:DsbC/DsbD-like thiol-disulfide interchange protein
MPLSRRFTLSVASCLLLCLLFAGCNNSKQPGAEPGASNTAQPKRIASENVVKVEAPAAEINAGASTEVNVRLKIDNGYHINANPATFPYLIPTELNIPQADGISAAKIKYPAPLQRTFSFAADAPLAVYEGQVELKAELIADKTAKPGQTSIPAKLSIQACDDQVCYPPGTIDVWIPVTVK